MLAGLWQVVGDANRYFAAQEPWALRKSDVSRMNTVLYVTAESVRQVAILAQPFMPDACGRMLDSLGIACEARDFASLGEAGRLIAGDPLPKPEPVFPRYVEAEDETSAG
jgi:methionyl-tRNA synthetase